MLRALNEESLTPKEQKLLRNKGTHCRQQKKPLYGEIINGAGKYSWTYTPQESLLWYYGETGVLKCPDRDEDRLGRAGSHGGHKGKKERMKNRVVKILKGAVKSMKTVVPVLQLCAFCFGT